MGVGYWADFVPHEADVPAPPGSDPARVLLLNASYEPLHICSWRRAVVLLLKGKAETVEAQARSAGRSQMPLVIRLLYYVKIPHKDIPLTRRNILHRDHYACQYCGRRSELTIDHVMPRSRGGGDTWDNVVTACQRCNLRKGNRTPQEMDMPLRRKPCRPFHFATFELSKQRHGQPLALYHYWKKYLFDAS